MAPLQALVESLLGPDLPVRFEAYDGTAFGPADAPATIVLRDEDALRHIVRAPGELGFARAYVSGSLDVEGDVFAVLDLQRRLPDVKLGPRQLATLARLVGRSALAHPPAIPAEERAVGGRHRGRHSKGRDEAAISHHYDVGNDFYRLVLGPSLTYSCAVFESAGDTLERAQANKYELISRKLGLTEGMRLLDVGCGWGGMVLHAARYHGVHAVGITISRQQEALARRRVADAGLSDRVEIRFQDYRDTADGPFDAVSSIGMFEHVGVAHLEAYVTRLRGLLRPGGRFLSHQISRPPKTPRRLRPERAAMAPRGFLNRYVFPDGELHEVGTLISAMQRLGFEVRHLESLREHYDLTLRHWLANLDAGWDEAVALTSEGRARVWRLYMAGAAAMFASGGTQVHQILGVATPTTGADRGDSGMALRNRWEAGGLDVGTDVDADTGADTGADAAISPSGAEHQLTTG